MVILYMLQMCNMKVGRILSVILNELIEGGSYCVLSYINFSSIASDFAPKVPHSQILN